MTLLDLEGGGLWAILVVLALSVLRLWTLFDSRYLAGEAELRIIIRTLPFPLSVVEPGAGAPERMWAQVASFREPWLGLTLSRDNVIIEIRRERWPRRIVISSRNAEEFPRVLQEQAPQMRVEGF